MKKMLRKRRRAQTAKQTASAAAPSELPTFLDHVYELRKRLFWVVAIIAVSAGSAYPFLDTILKVLRAPLGSQQLYYLTPVGGLSFSIKICMYVGIMVAVPFIMYHLYRFLEPLMGQRMRRSALFYVGLSSFFAIGGVLFAYFVSLPGALQFLTGLNLSNIQAMLTVDSYLSFVMTYLLGAAILFQIPLLLLIINTMTPFKPGGLGKSQRYVIVAAFIIAAVISPTPDLMNQIMFALPIIGMYELGVVLVWFQNRSRKRNARKAEVLAAQQQPAQPVQVAPVPQPKPVVAAAQPAVARPAVAKPAVQAVAKSTPRPQFVDIMAPRSRQNPRLAPPQPRPTGMQPRQLRVPTRSIDGFMPYRPPQPTNAS